MAFFATFATFAIGTLVEFFVYFFHTQIHIRNCWILGIGVIRPTSGGCSQKCLVGALIVCYERYLEF